MINNFQTVVTIKYESRICQLEIEYCIIELGKNLQEYQ